MAASIFSLFCPECGGKQYLTPNLERFRCYYCNKELFVDRSGGDTTLTTSAARLEQKEQSVEAGARPRGRADDELLLKSVLQEREATAYSLKEQQRRMEKRFWKRLWGDAGAWFWERDLIFAVAAVVLAVWGALDSLVRGITGQASPVDVAVGMVVCLFLAVFFIDYARFCRSEISSERREDARITEQKRELEDKAAQLRRREAEIRRRLQ